MRLVAAVLYTGYLVYAGLTLVLLPWHDAWDLLILRAPYHWAVTLDQPWVRGLISSFGVLHLAIVTAEIALPFGLREVLSDGGSSRRRQPPRHVESGNGPEAADR